MFLFIKNELLVKIISINVINSFHIFNSFYNNKEIKGDLK